MRWCRLSALLVMAIILAGHFPAAGQDDEKKAPEEGPFKVDFVIHPLVAALPPPDFYGKLVTEQMAR